MPPKPPERPQEKTPKALDAPPAPVPVWALAIVPTKRMGQTEHSIVALQVVGDRVTRHVPLPDGNWERVEEALRDLQRAAVRMYRFKQVDELLAGRA